jgi:hypothetical protein
MDMGYDQEPVLPALITVPPQSRYPFRSLQNYVTPFLCKLLPIPMNEFTSAQSLSSHPFPHLILTATAA